MELAFAAGKIREGLSKKSMVAVFGFCEADYRGRAVSRLPKGKRLVLIKGDNSISIHQNRLVRPTNYMMNTRISLEAEGESLVMNANRTCPKERLSVRFHGIFDVQCYDMEISNDLRLSGSERDLNEILMEDLSMIEPGLRPINQQEHFRKGIADIIAEDTAGKLVVIELKRRQADYASVTQLQRYMKEVERIKGVESRGILLAPGIRPKARELLERAGLEFAKIDFELLPSESKKASIRGLEKKQQTMSDFSQEKSGEPVGKGRVE